MVARGVRAVILLALFFSMGGHLAFLQSLAWTRMVIGYSHQNPIGISIQKTFDGQHPCPLCLKLKKAANPSGSLGMARGEPTLDIVLPAATFQILRHIRSWAIHSPSLISFVTPVSIDSPPPESILS
jgi:hypothetical protein